MFKRIGVPCNWAHIIVMIIIFATSAVIQVSAAESPKKDVLKVKAVCDDICRNNAAKCKKFAIANGKSQNEAIDSCKNICSKQDGSASCIKYVRKSISDIQELNNKCELSWGELIKQMDRRRDIISDLIPDMMVAYKDTPEKQNIIDVLQDAISRYTKAISPAGKMSANNMIDRTLYRLFRDLDRYDELNTNVKLTSLKKDITGPNNLISMVQRNYNKNVKIFNQLVGQNTYIAKQWGFKEKPYYTPVLKYEY